MDKKDIIIYPMTVRQNEMENCGLGVLGGITEGTQTIEAEGRNEISFTTKSNFYNSDRLKNNYVVRVNGQPYRIHQVSNNPITKEIKVQGRHLLYDLNDPIDRFSYYGMTMRAVIEDLLGGYFSQVFNVVFDDPTGVFEGFSVTYDSEGIDADLTITSAILNLIQPYGLILVRDNNNLIIKNINGVLDQSKLLISWENIECFNKTNDSTTLFTRVWPLGKENVELPEKYIYVEGLTERTPHEITKKMVYDTDSLDELRYLATECAGKAGKLFENISLKLSDVKKSEKYKFLKDLFEFSVGDVVTIMLGEYRERKRIVNKKVNLLTGEINIELGDSSSDFIDSMANEQKELETKTRDLLRVGYYSESNPGSLIIGTTPKDLVDISFGSTLGGMNSKIFFTSCIRNENPGTVDISFIIKYKGEPLIFTPIQTLIPGYTVLDFTYPIFNVQSSEKVVVTATATGNVSIATNQLNVLIDLFGGNSNVVRKSPDTTIYQDITGNTEPLEIDQNINILTPFVYRHKIAVQQTTAPGNVSMDTRQSVNFDFNI